MSTDQVSTCFPSPALEFLNISCSAVNEMASQLPNDLPPEKDSGLKIIKPKKARKITQFTDTMSAEAAATTTATAEQSVPKVTKKKTFTILKGLFVAFPRWHRIFVDQLLIDSIITTINILSSI